MNFGTALFHLKKGDKVAREGWNGKGMWLALADLGIETHLPYIMMKTADGRYVPWTSSQTDILAEDWIVIE